MKKMDRRVGLVWIIALTLTLSHTALGHPGHSLAEGGLTHALSSPFHLLVLLGSAIALWCGAHLVRRASVRRLLQASAVAFITAAAVLWSSLA